MKTFHLILVSLVIASTISGQQITEGPLMQARFVDEALSHLSARISPDQRGQLTKRAEAWRLTKSESDWVALTDEIYAVARENGDVSHVTIATSPNSGATVKYETLGQRKRNEAPTTAKNLSKLTEVMFSGVYYIWSERKGKATSNLDAQYDIFSENASLTLAEDK